LANLLSIRWCWACRLTVNDWRKWHAVRPVPLRRPSNAPFRRVFRASQAIVGEVLNGALQSAATSDGARQYCVWSGGNLGCVPDRYIPCCGSCVWLVGCVLFAFDKSDEVAVCVQIEWRRILNAKDNI